MSFLVYTLMKIYNRGNSSSHGFISIRFLVVKLKIFKVLRTDSASNMALFGRCFGHYSPWFSLILLKFSLKVDSSRQKACLKTFWRIRVFMEKGRTKTLHFRPTFTLRFPLKIVEIGNNKHCCGETSAVGPSKCVKIKALSPLPFPGKMRLLFTIFGLFLPGSRAGSQVKGLENLSLRKAILSTPFLSTSC